eukprot:scaffold657_cov561-Prasinococcus_capsulatus_cf.AAC.3
MIRAALLPFCPVQQKPSGDFKVPAPPRLEPSAPSAPSHASCATTRPAPGSSVTSVCRPHTLGRSVAARCSPNSTRRGGRL